MLAHHTNQVFVCQLAGARPDAGLLGRVTRLGATVVEDGVELLEHGPVGLVCTGHGFLEVGVDNATVGVLNLVFWAVDDLNAFDLGNSVVHFEGTGPKGASRHLVDWVVVDVEHIPGLRLDVDLDGRLI